MPLDLNSLQNVAVVDNRGCPRALQSSRKVAPLTGAHKSDESPGPCSPCPHSKSWRVLCGLASQDDGRPGVDISTSVVDAHIKTWSKMVDKK